MRIFALETNNEKACKEILLDGECTHVRVQYHWLLFAARIFPSVIAALIIAIAYAIPTYIYGSAFALHWAALIAVFLMLFVMVLLPVLRSWIDWRYDGIILTDRRLLILNQTSIFKEDNRKMDLENVASVRAITQYWNIFPFGKLHIDLKEGVGRSIILPFVPNAANIAKRISQCVCDNQSRTSQPSQ